MRFDNDNKEIWPAIGELDFVNNERLLNSIFISISSEDVDGVDCYVLNGKMRNVLYKDGSKSYKVYLEKDTGLVKQIIEEYEKNGQLKKAVSKYRYEFNCVTDTDLRAPDDISEYVIEK